MATSIKIDRKKSIGARVSDREYSIISEWAESEGLNKSDFMIQAINTHSFIKSKKPLILECIRKNLQNPAFIFDHERKKNLEVLLKFMVEL